MSSGLLEKEKEFYKRNQEIEIRTKELMNEVDAVMKIHDNLSSEHHHSNSIVSKFKPQLNYNFQPSAGRELLTDVLSKDDDVDGIPDSVNEMGFRGMSQFFKAKFKKAQSDYDKLQVEHRNKCEELKKLEKQNQKLSEEKDKWFHIATGHKTHINKLDSQVTVINSKLQARENENISLKKDIDQLRKELKSGSMNTGQLEIRLKKATDESEKYRAAYRNIKQEEKDLRESHKKQIDEMSSVIKRIEKHKNELLNGFKKQLLLIDNLRKQKAHIEQYKLCEKTEKDFMKILDWKVES